MTVLLFLLFLGVCSCHEEITADIFSWAPDYMTANETVHEAAEILESQILSMDGAIPYLNDSRRHYAEIIHVVWDEAKLQASCNPPNYYESYQHNINTSAAEGVSNPQQVIDEMKWLVKKYSDKTEKIRDSFNRHCSHLNAPAVCNHLVQRDINIGVVPQYQGEVLLNAGRAAREHLYSHDTFIEVSRAHRGHQYVINGVGVLSTLVKLFSLLLKLLIPNFGC